MPNELIWQRRICSQIRSEGGYGKKWSSQFQVGVPDLILGHPLFGFFAMEVKLLKDIDIDKGFDRQTGITPKQMLEINRMKEAGLKAGMGVVVEWRGSQPPILVLVGGADDRISSTPSGYLKCGEHLCQVARWRAGKFVLNISELIGVVAK